MTNRAADRWSPGIALSKGVSGPMAAIGGLFAMSLDAVRYVFQRPFQWREFLEQSWFVARVLPGWWRERARSPAAAFALIVLGFYLIPILVGPACLKMETERCWSWITVLPLAGVAQAVAARADGPRVLVWLLAAGLLPYLGSRLFICYLS